MILQTKHKIFLASLAYRPIRWGRALLGKKQGGQFKRNGLVWELDLGEVVDFMIYLSGAFEPGLSQFIRNHLKKGQIAIDIGANIGAHSLSMAQAVGKEGRAYAVEATEYAFGKLSRNIELNPEIASQIQPLHCMLLAEQPGEETGLVEEIHSSWPFDTKEDRHGTHQGVSKQVGQATRTTLDTLVEEIGLQHLDLVKIDVDGNEWDVLKGGQASFVNLQPTIIMEAALDYHTEDDPKSFQNIHSLLKSYGYRLYNLNGKPLPETIEGLKRIITPGSSMNVLALPEAKRE